MAKRRIDVSGSDYRPVYVVWELTLSCDQPCTHCGSRAGDARKRELSTAEALDVVRQLAAMRAEEIALIGGEAYLHPGFLDVIAAIRAAGIRCTMTTGGRSLDAQLAREMARAGLEACSVSVDGLAHTHDVMRASPGSFEAATSALRHLAAAGVRALANTNFNRWNAPDLEPLYAHLRDAGIRAWQVQLTAPLGRAADRPDMLLQPWDLLDLLPRIAAIKQKAWAEGVLVMPGNNLGYFGPEEALLRSQHPGDADHVDHFQGCLAGRFLMGIESDGSIKGCPSLQTSHYVGGNVTDRPLAEIWAKNSALSFTRTRTVDELWGYCRICPFAATCMGGCSFTAHAFFGRPGNNPYCHYRARAFARDGKRERLVPREPAPGEPFDCGRFDIVVEPHDAPEPPMPAPRERLLRIRRPDRAA